MKKKLMTLLLGLIIGLKTFQVQAQVQQVQSDEYLSFEQKCLLALKNQKNDHYDMATIFAFHPIGIVAAPVLANQGRGISKVITLIESSFVVSEGEKAKLNYSNDEIKDAKERVKKFYRKYIVKKNHVTDLSYESVASKMNEALTAGVFCREHKGQVYAMNMNNLSSRENLAKFLFANGVSADIEKIIAKSKEKRPDLDFDKLVTLKEKEKSKAKSQRALAGNVPTQKINDKSRKTEKSSLLSSFSFDDEEEEEQNGESSWGSASEF